MTSTLHHLQVLATLYMSSTVHISSLISREAPREETLLCELLQPFCSHGFLLCCCCFRQGQRRDDLWPPLMWSVKGSRLCSTGMSLPTVKGGCGLWTCSVPASGFACKPSAAPKVGVALCSPGRMRGWLFIPGSESCPGFLPWPIWKSISASSAVGVNLAPGVQFVLHSAPGGQHAFCTLPGSCEQGLLGRLNAPLEKHFSWVTAGSLSLAPWLHSKIAWAGLKYQASVESATVLLINCL